MGEHPESVGEHAESNERDTEPVLGDTEPRQAEETQTRLSGRDSHRRRHRPGWVGETATGGDTDQQGVHETAENGFNEIEHGSGRDGGRTLSRWENTLSRWENTLSQNEGDTESV